MDRQSSPGRPLLIALAMLGVLAFGCSAGLSISAGGTPRPTPIPARTLPPTPVPTEVPAVPTTPPEAAVASPTPTLKPGKGKRVAYRVFYDHFAASVSDLQLIIGAIERHSDPLDVPRLVTDLEDAAAWAAKQTVWLHENRPRPCYENRHGAMTSAVAKYEEGFDLMAAALTSLDQVKLRQGMGVVEQANAILQAAEPDTCGQQHSAG